VRKNSPFYEKKIGKVRLWKEITYCPNEYIQDYTQQYHSRYWKIKTKILLFHPNIAREIANKMQFIAEEINNNTNNDDDCPNADDDFACVVVHSYMFWLLI
jgi:hypothetical protein